MSDESIIVDGGAPEGTVVEFKDGQPVAVIPPVEPVKEGE